MIALAFFMIGSQSGSVISVTKISPSSNSLSFLTSVMILALPDAILVPTEIPVTIGEAVVCNLYSVISKCFFSAWTVSGRACTMKSSPVIPSLAHSISIGVSLPACWV